MLSSLIANPLTKLSNLGLGVLLAYIYVQIIDYRKIKSEEVRKAVHPSIYFAHKNSTVGWIAIFFALFIVLGNLTLPLSNYSDPAKASPFMNGLYFALSRPSWVFAVFIFSICIFAGRFGIARAILSNGNMRTFGKATVCTCVIQIFMV